VRRIVTHAPCPRANFDRAHLHALQFPMSTRRAQHLRTVPTRHFHRDRLVTRDNPIERPRWVCL